MGFGRWDQLHPYSGYKNKKIQLMITRASIPIPPVENAIKQTLTHGMAYISLQVTHSNPNTQTQSTYILFTVFKDEAKPQFTGILFNISLNAVLFAQKVIGYPICWNGAIPIDCYIDVNAPTAITWHNTLADLNKQLGLQAQKNMVFLLCLLSLTKCVIDLASSLVYRQILVLDPMSSNIINVESNYELLKKLEEH
ncbi:MAG: hypothetical protein EZS28_031205 [Streblomastix strix]|uniref:Uncharacterized protein n=1 Tax=Streblomastix strix TaxID=222440 RepID=A0A5J4US81_9EUKA|nr:MAG: hypothetical protein EZS28_031205 [Streblomastix strix]